ncbi:hypothetical protein HG536_0A00690 [Torulaspora globosa]|uniref:GPI transamidase component GPI16 n=1 Tax=Torulaspora globosa TaxID=48254 RepID=A0A7G3Z9R6_9SACH|nr:uncharacterized protein HG536_0A00690 [Torulaspora globosa]QLL30252.1 hypothetical protein HG536_0A00690 [Torulaspora globosa]
MKGRNILVVLSCLLSWVVCEAEVVESSATLEIDQDIELPKDKGRSAGTYEESCVVSGPYSSATESSLVDDVLPREDRVAQTEEMKPTSIVVEGRVSYPYEEDLVITPLANNYLLSSFTFNMQSEDFSPGKSALDYDEYGHYTVFPKAFKPIMDLTSTRQLHLRFTRGFWDAESWGRLPHDGFRSGGSGVELWAAIEADTKDEAYRQWKTLANSLSGLFCASINFIDRSKTTFPVKSFQPDGSLPLFNSTKRLHLVRAALANEPVCTENLTPFVKLFPTKGKSGLSSLLDGHKVFDSSWHSLSIDVTTECDDASDHCRYALEAHVDVVINVLDVLARYERPIPRPAASDSLRCDTSKPFDAFQCFPLSDETEVSFNLSKIFGKPIMGSNLISSRPSRVCVDIANDWNAYIEVDGVFYSTDDNCFDLKDLVKQNVYIESANSLNVVKSGEPPLYISRSLTGYGQDRGGLRTVFKNPSSHAVRAIYFESLPWFMRVYLSTLKLEPGANFHENLTLENVMNSTYYLPAVDRARPTHLEYTITVPANTSFAISYQFDKSLLQYAEYPPDANHGFEIEAAVITVIEPSRYQMRTAPLLLLLSTPDFSMPYNVIILTSTVIGLIFGTLFNLLVKRLVPVEVADKIEATSGLKHKVRNLRAILLAKLKRPTS